jgi:predicted TIM-barrel fold metal-dependent hydrolase
MSSGARPEPGYVDVHGHFAPLGETGGGPPSLRDPQRSLEIKRELGITLTIIGSPAGPGSMLPDAAADNYRQPVDRVRAHNEAMAELVDRYPQDLRAYAYVNPLGGEAMLAQAADLLTHWQFVGLIANSSIDGSYLDGAEAADFFAMAAQAGVPVLLHPPAAPVGASSIGRLGLVEHVARVCDVTMGIAAIVCAGWLERHPELLLIAAAGGGGLAHLPEKLDLAMAERPGSRTGTSGFAGLSEPPSRSLRRILVECSCPSPVQLRANLETFGSENVLFGTDAPPLMPEAGRVVDLVSDPGLDEEVRQNIAWRNAGRVFGLDVPVPVATG